MTELIFTELTNKPRINTNNIAHTIINYVDDSSNLISGKNPDILQDYIDKYHSLLETYYNINYLKINSDKSN